MQDPNLPTWGAQDRFQAHFIVRKTGSPIDFIARTILNTKGHFGSKKVTGVSWNGGKLADILNQDSELNKRISKQDVNDATILVEPTENEVRIHGKWKNHFDFGITKEMFEIYDKIAGHIKTI
ncbi:MAG: hypothetical protein NPMRTH4_1980013 [Nitrosopumilales archaeon]|nr:MAG: hypothetical protein NPMRTH4_1980013 [Nitrosopumilales archaeon]